ncbi:M20 family metallo-hydrolase [Maritimibacter dapengensis]|uniref:M20 family metallo-hydrolase n=1 Tax=Maritimibacter dapengensis TaxID=2836868 RepID=A0ABS6SZX8_9RHOB|nr:M20 family metallo-hydrolase [Maritimibacter dapengensis]MBV7378078.1 M20 family metallo-hydrolase [Maritimibacter dapengensis]
MTDWGLIAAERLARIARCSAPGPGVTRLPFTTEHTLAIEDIRGWMTAAGMETTLDAAGTLVGRIGTPENTFYMGSHQDSVREGGAFDGIMGVALACLGVEKARADGTTLPFSIEVLAFADEEGVRFPTALIGPRALAGTIDMDVMTLTDRDGIALGDALGAFGGDPASIPALARPRDRAIGYLETHIEQGPVLEDADEALGVVTAICGIERHSVIFRGETGHAGTLPMNTRRDALVGASEFVTAAHETGLAQADLRVTVGELHVAPNVVNAVPREVTLTLEIRAPEDGMREAAGALLHEKAKEIAARRSLDLDMRRVYQQPAQPCDPALREALTEAVVAAGGRGLALPSGATHDASAMADLCPISMLFVRCRDGVSHVPEEHASADDMGRAVGAIADMLARIGAAHDG